MAGTLKVGTITTPSGSGSITIPSGVSLSGGVANTPNFFVRSDTTGFSLSAGSHTKVTSWTTPEFDTASAWSDNKFTIPSGQAGKYCVSASAYFNYTGSAKRFQMSIRVNGSADGLATISATYNNSAKISYTKEFSVGDYIEMYLYQDQVNSTAYTAANNAEQTFLSIYKLIGA